MKEASEALNKIVDIVLAYRPKPKPKATNNCQRMKIDKKKNSSAEMTNRRENRR